MAQPLVPISYTATTNAPKALASYTQAVKAGNTIYCSGCLGMDAKTGEMQGVEDINIQTTKCLDNLKAVVEASGGLLSSVVKVTIFLSDMQYYAAVNEIYMKYFPSNPPARSCFAVKELPRKALIEIECVAIECK
jgi:2-iminobutanoate/2-iminopropanoate deaminase